MDHMNRRMLEKPTSRIPSYLIQDQEDRIPMFTWSCGISCIKLRGSWVAKISIWRPGYLQLGTRSTPNPAIFRRHDSVASQKQLP